ncbi:MAG TPA: TrkA family potassium uptake protein [Firmicutes bacterium]|nr:TrkA family potassium uptake protein [Bacillota bacterium]
MKEFAVLGLGRFGTAVARALFELGHFVLGVDEDEAKVASISQCCSKAVRADVTEEETLKALAVWEYDAVVVAMGNLQASLMTVILLKELGTKYVIAKAASDIHGKVLRKIGADRVVFPERDMGVRVARNLTAFRVMDHLEVSPEFSLVELTVGKEMANKTLRQLNLRARYGVNVLMVKKGQEAHYLPLADEVVTEGDVLVVAGRNDALSKFERVLEDAARAGHLP